ncbi:MAG TPA: hypothetical protein VEX15_13970, partial [Nocardioidaceae bacterium]|nr:hypothetical protein [Nocardioidaceae bacterium]
KALLRLAALWNVPVASNLATADMLISSPLLDNHYVPVKPDFADATASRHSAITNRDTLDDTSVERAGLEPATQGL